MMDWTSCLACTLTRRSVPLKWSDMDNSLEIKLGGARPIISLALWIPLITFFPTSFSCRLTKAIAYVEPGPAPDSCLLQERPGGPKHMDSESKIIRMKAYRIMEIR